MQPYINAASSTKSSGKIVKANVCLYGTCVGLTALKGSNSVLSQVQDSNQLVVLMVYWITSYVNVIKSSFTWTLLFCLVSFTIIQYIAFRFLQP